ncbi:MAG: hypothetical protein ACTSUG_10155 [Candidatus Helarchaeota archaeon]
MVDYNKKCNVNKNIVFYNNFNTKKIKESILNALIEIVNELYVSNNISTYEKYLVPLKNLRDDTHLIYLAEYLKKINCKTIIKESNYIDKVYLNDFSQFYVRCFPHYKKTCSRLHFFNLEITEDDFYDNYLLGKNLQEHYLGFSIIKPLPFFLGRTCVKPYFDPNNNSTFFIQQKYEVNLCGKPLHINSLIFHDKDKATAACSTVALWICFQMTSHLFKNHLPLLSPLEVTKLASKSTTSPNRLIPNKSLTTLQVVSIIKELNLELEQRKARNKDIFSFIYAYIHYKIPIILLIERYKNNRRIGHAVIVSGIIFNNYQENKFLKGKIKLKAHFINELLIHDDKIGPYIKVTLEMKENSYNHYYTIHIGNNEYKINNIIVPVYHKIRVALEDILYNKFFIEINNLFNEIFSQNSENNKNIVSTIMWDIFLTDINEFKKDIANLNIDTQLKKSILISPYPKYLWRAIMYNYKKDKIIPIFEFQVDATDLPKSIFIYKSFFYGKYNIFFKLGYTVEGLKNKKYTDLVEKIKDRLIKPIKN